MWLTSEESLALYPPPRYQESWLVVREKCGRRKGDQTGAVCVAPSHWLWFP